MDLNYIGVHIAWAPIFYTNTFQINYYTCPNEENLFVIARLACSNHRCNGQCRDL